MRPKSMATVVSFLRDLVESVIPRSVESTVISLIVRISVVFPAANGPVTTTLTACPPCDVASCPWPLEPPHSGDEPQQEAAVHTRVAFDEP